MEPAIQTTPTEKKDQISWKTTALVIGIIILLLSGAGLGVGYAFFWDKPAHEDTVDYQKDYAYNLVKNNPKNPDLRVELAYVLVQEGKLNEAQKELENALALDKNHFGAKLNLAIVMGEKGDMKGAKKKLEEVAKENPKNEDAKFLLGQAYIELGEYKKSREQFDFLLKLNPGTIDYIYWTAKAFEMEGNKEKAIELYQKTITYVPDYAPSLEALKGLGVKDLPNVVIPNTPSHGEIGKEEDTSNK